MKGGSEMSSYIKNNDFNFEHLSVTSLKMMLRCPLQFMFRYVKGLKIPPVGAIVLGKSVHRGLEENFRHKQQSKKDLSLSKVLEAYSSFFDLEKQQEEIDWEGENPGKIKDEGVSLIKVYHKEIAPPIQPLAVEEEFILEFENVPYTLKGYLDLVDQNKTIRDTKTARRSYPQDAAQTDIQLTAYNLAYKYLKGEEPKSLCFDIMVRTKQPKVQTLQSPPRTQAQLTRFLKLLGSIARAIKTGIFYPCENQQVCSWCGYREVCKKW
jgi:CRISPR/Cas system-associated exonuclease Cas4 (RecB family)